MINKHQIKIIHTLLTAYAKHRGFPIEREEKEQFVSQCSNGRCTSTTELSQAEARTLIYSLQELTGSTTEYQKADRERKLIIHYAHQMNWELKDGKADMKRISSWCVKYGYLHKPLMQYNSRELPRLVQQFQKMYLAFLKHI